MLSFEQIQHKLEYFCIYQERCSYEVKKKLIHLKANESQIKKIINYLIKDNFLCNERYTESYISGKIAIKKWGKHKIIQNLRQNKIDENLIQKYISLIDEELYIDNLTKLLQKKFHQVKGELLEKSNKTKQFLYNKGYELELILSELNKLIHK